MIYANFVNQQAASYILILVHEILQKVDERVYSRLAKHFFDWQAMLISLTKIIITYLRSLSLDVKLCLASMRFFPVSN